MKIVQLPPPKQMWSYEALATYTGTRAGRGTDLHTGTVCADTEAEALEEAYEDAWDYPFRHIYCGQGDGGFFEKEVVVTVQPVNQQMK